MNLGSRLVYALIGLVGGAMFGGLLWLLLDFGFHFRWSTRGMHVGIQQWVKYSAAFFCVVGFIFQDRVGSALGFGINEAYEYEVATRSSPEIPTWLALVVLAAVSFAVWYFTK